MIPILSRAQMRAFDAHAIETCHVPSLVLMENAGRGATDVIERELLADSAKDRVVIVVAGTGNNGGDGFVVARHLMTRGAHVQVWLVGDPQKLTADCRANRDAFAGTGGDVRAWTEGSVDDFVANLRDSDIAIDALFGTGLDRPISQDSPFGQAITRLGEATTPVAALDVPSGLDTDTGLVLGGFGVQAALTVTFAHLKLGHMTAHGAKQCGPVHVVDIGVPAALSKERSAELLETADVKACFTPRPIDNHKYKAGHVAIFGGSAGKTGAPLLAAVSALRSGAGAATIVSWPEALRAIESRVLEVMVASLDPSTAASSSGDRSLLASVDAALGHKNVVVIGPGFGTDERAGQVTTHVLATFPGTIVVDADAITLHAGKPEAFQVAGGRVILTPHAGELARLLGKTSEEIEANRFDAVREAARRTGGIVLLKGAYTVVAMPDGHAVVSGEGVPPLGTAGSGDVLSGLIGALACGMAPFAAAYCGAFLHGVSGSAWQKVHGDRGLLASEIADGMPSVLAALLA